MNDKPKRPWFRFHLLTLVLIALAAGGWMLLNESSTRATFRPDGYSQPSYWQGWLLSCRKFYVRDGQQVTVRWDYTNLAVVAAAGLFLLGLVGFVSESILRRREDAKP